MSYRPITDVAILARSKTKYYGAFPAGFLHRGRALLGVHLSDPVLHVCAGKVREYQGKGFGPNDKTLDLDQATAPDFLQDARDPLPMQRCNVCLGTRQVLHESGYRVCQMCIGLADAPWSAVLIDAPYTADDADRYVPGRSKLPNLNALLKSALGVVAIGSRVGVLDYLWPHPGAKGKEVAVVAVGTGRNGRARWYTVFERLA